MTKVGVIGLGMMGGTHLDAYAKMDNVQVVAISDANPKRLSGDEAAAGNIEGQAQAGFDINSPDVAKYTEGMDLINDPNVDLVDVCLPTPMHVDYGVAALKAGKHLLVEKPVARTSADAAKLIEAANASDKVAMCAMCMRFWPGWDWLKEAVENKTYGSVKAATFRRLSNHPGGAFYKDGAQCGGAALDLHIHDTDFVNYLFGTPKSVISTGYSQITDHVDHIVTHYEYDNIPLVVAEGGWAMQDGFGFSMRYTVNFENATAIFDLGAEHPLMLAKDGKSEPVKLGEGMGYDHEIAYLIDCIENGKKPTVVTLEQAAESVRIQEAEIESVKTGSRVSL